MTTGKTNKYGFSPSAKIPKEIYLIISWKKRKEKKPENTKTN